MTSPSPLMYETYYHIYNRGINRENIFFQERNYNYFLNLYARHIEPVAETFAYCLRGKQQYLDLHSQWVSDAESQWISENDAD